MPIASLNVNARACARTVIHRAWGLTCCALAAAAGAQTPPPAAQAVVWQDGRAAPVTQTGPNAYSVQLRNAPFSITIPNRNPAGQPLAPSDALIGVCVSRDPALFTGIAAGRSVGVMPCLNGASTFARAATETSANMTLHVSDSGSDGDGHYLYDNQNTVFAPGVSTLHVRAIDDTRTVGTQCTGKGYGNNCCDLTQTQPYPGGTLHAIVYTDLNENRLADPGEFWLLTLRLDGPAPKSTATTASAPPPEPTWGPLGRPLARLNGTDVLYMADVLTERRRTASPGAYESSEPLSKGLAALADQVLAGQEAKRLGLWAGPAPALANSPDTAARATDRLQGAQAYAQHIGAGVPAPTLAQVQTYYDTWPELFSQRKVYRLEQITPEPGHMHSAGLQLDEASLLSPIRMAAFLTHNAVPFQRVTVTVPAESFPLTALRALAKLPILSPGMAVEGGPGRPVAYFVHSAQSAPITLDTARPHIETFLHNQARRTAVEQAVRRLASAAKFEQFGPRRPPAAPAGSSSGAASASASAP